MTSSPDFTLLAIELGDAFGWADEVTECVEAELVKAYEAGVKKGEQKCPPVLEDCVTVKKNHNLSVSRARVDTEGSVREEDAPYDYARDIRRAPEDREGRVRAVMDLMSAGRWVRGKTAAILAAGWDLEVNTVEAYAAEASRRVKSGTDQAWVKERVSTALNGALDDSNGDPKLTAEVAKAYAAIAQVTSPVSVQIILGHPLVAEVMARIGTTLEAFPEAKLAVEEMFEAVQVEQRGVKRMGG